MLQATILGCTLYVLKYCRVPGMYSNNIVYLQNILSYSVRDMYRNITVNLLIECTTVQQYGVSISTVQQYGVSVCSMRSYSVPVMYCNNSVHFIIYTLPLYQVQYELLPVPFASYVDYFFTQASPLSPPPPTSSPFSIASSHAH